MPRKRPVSRNEVRELRERVKIQGMRLNEVEEAIGFLQTVTLGKPVDTMEVETMELCEVIE